ncbi:hypothetical protein CL673_01170 [Candidatus Bathyarchaeota archaeon]|jgi:hypothetical protein|nr:hypothetical protein [Candidatus Bathyarchaeota archaeon]MDP6049383.1 collagen-like protein [Candidatus Bathyarchaeota archaeon]|tara:strand:+ start:789 stop:1415 length:627 start_codon:yes stop_codon:yes gene_type:complete
MSDIDWKTIGVTSLISAIIAILVVSGLIMSIPMIQDALRGPEGAQGTQGIPGDQGAQGIPGDQGLRGETGLAGLQGSRGLKGDQGEIGLPGKFSGHWERTLLIHDEDITTETIDVFETFTINNEMGLWMVDWWSASSSSSARSRIRIYEGIITQDDIRNGDASLFFQTSAQGKLVGSTDYAFGTGVYTIRVRARYADKIYVRINQILK